MNFHNVQFETSFGVLRQLPPPEHVEIVFSGRSNVGKSSMINKIFNRKKLAKVSSVPGKTQTINFFKIDGEPVRFVDLPGYGYAKVSKKEKERWGDLVDGYFIQDRNIGLVFQLVDVRHAPTVDDLSMINFLIDNEMPFVIVLTKLDKLSKTQRIARLESLQTEVPYADQITMIPFSAETGEGVEKIHEIIIDIASRSERED